MALLLFPLELSSQPAGVDGTRVSLEAQAKDLGDVLADLSRQVGVGIIHKGQSSPAVTLSLTNVSFSDCLDTLADVFSLVAWWEDRVLMVQGFDGVVDEAAKQLDAGRSDLLAVLSALGQGTRRMYGGEELRKRLSEAVGALVQTRARAALQGATEPEVALALAHMATDEETRLALGATAVRGLVYRGRLSEAQQVWRDLLKDHSGLQAAAATADLFMALHYTRAESAAAFWAESFSSTAAIQLLQEAWRQHAYGPGLTLARLNLQYARAAGRVPEAQELEQAILRCLDSPRVVRVTCAVDREAISDPQCESKIRRRIAYLSEVYGRNFGIGFSLEEFVLWDPPSDNSYERQYAALKAALGGRTPELTIGFILEVIPMHPADFHPEHLHLWVGYGCPHMGPYLLTRDFSFENVDGEEAQQWTFTSAAVAETLVHEMGHMFGALHVDDRNSVMRPVTDDKHPTEFDDLNKRLILAHKWQDLTLRTASLDEPELLALVEGYRRIAGASQTPNGANEEEARVHLALAKLYLQRLQVAQARDQLHQVMAIGAPAEVVEEAKALLGVNGG